MSDVIVSYARVDRELVATLEARGFAIWWDREILPGEVWRTKLTAQLGKAKCLIVVWSTGSVRSEFVHDEASRAKKRGVLLPTPNPPRPSAAC